MAFQPIKPFIEKLLSSPISSFQIGEGCNANDNVAGSLKSLVAISSPSGAKISTVLKTFPAKDSPHYEYIKDGGIFRIETDVYLKLFPALENFVESKRAAAPYGPPIPKIIGHFHDDENDFICLEDIRPLGFTMPSVFSGLTYPETSLILKELAHFHAYSYALIQHQGEQLFENEFFRLDMRNKQQFREEKLQAWYFMLGTSVGQAVAVLKQINPKLAARLAEEIPSETVGALFSSLTEATGVEFFPCILHGDLWSNNCLFKYDKDGAPRGVKFVDFQHTRRGNIFEDLVYFILTSTTSEMRGEHLNGLLEDYFRAFSAALDNIHVKLPIGFSLGFLVDNFHRFLKWGLSYMCFAIPLQLGNPGDVYREQASRKRERENLNAGLTVNVKEEEEVEGKPEGDELRENLQLMFESSLAARVRLEEVTQEILNMK